MAAARVISEAGLAFIKAHEGFRPRATRLPGGRWLLGYSAIEDDAEGREITPEEAEARLLADLAPVRAVIDEIVFAPLSERQRDALVSFGFSIGAEALRSCGIADALNDGRPIDAAEVFDRWRLARVGFALKPVDALVRRRAAEKAMFLELESGPVAASSALLRPALHEGDRGSGPVAAPERPEAEVVERVGKILLEPGGRSARSESAPARATGERRTPISQLPSAPYPLRRSVSALAAETLLRKRAELGAFLGRDGAPSLAAPLRPSDARAQWPWLVGGGGLALIAVGLANIRAAAEPAAEGASDVGWALALVAGVLLLGAGAYYAARRLAGVD